MELDRPIAYMRKDGVGAIIPVFAPRHASNSNDSYQHRQPYGSLEAEMQRRRQVAASLGPTAHTREATNTAIVTFEAINAPIEYSIQPEITGDEGHILFAPTTQSHDAA